MESSTLVSIRAQNDARMTEEKRILDRRRNVMVLINQHCIQNGYLETAEKLSQEAGIALSKFETCDNIDLENIVCEFEAYYEMKFGKKPKLARKRAGGSEDGGPSNAPKMRRRPRPTKSQTAPEAGQRRPSQPQTVSSSNGNKKGGASDKNEGLPEIGDMGIQGSKSGIVENGPNRPSDLLAKNDKRSPKQKGGGGFVGAGSYDVASAQAAAGQGNGNQDWEPPELRLLKPLPLFHQGDDETRKLAAVITRDIFQESPDVKWEDVVGLDDAKRLLKEAVTMPLRYPQLFTGLLSPWGGVLLYGPPGTGKTMLAKAVATECQTTFFNISASTIVSKYRGDSEKLVRVLFELARYHAPSTIFLDEIDSIMGQRGGFEGGAGEHEGSRRMKTELLIQMDGLSRRGAALAAETDLGEAAAPGAGGGGKGGGGSGGHVFVLAASNLPWELDLALLRRLEKRVLAPLPARDARLAMLRKHLAPPRLAEAVELEPVADQTEGFSGSDLKLLCKEAAMRPVRRLLARLEGLEVERAAKAADEAAAVGRRRGGGRLPPAALAAPPPVPAEEVEQLVLGDPISAADVAAALTNTRPSAALYKEKYAQWQRDFGAV